MDQLVYFIARVSLTTTPAAWLVKGKKKGDDTPFMTRERAWDHLMSKGETGKFISPLYATVKVDMCVEEILHLIFPPLSEDRKEISLTGSDNKL